ncbi:MAG: phosphate acyltransferase PlsX [Armatimonadota bacterium]|nr:phosphate acyltransferase PlsX [Armatimonadota bacterium]MDR7450292.1 phosphate acyltransferase PlsX [Armatimonadota bacterium]MDR7467125.1 phosphate acyltransferase PlsX [Armatimonadota bacterium]MDR7493333.1 phosphate acyltransferase PlsX [Armatimonadota bacterium]MDR7499341.1 phosphate acyltransferase PlsX [Armatimonadota bacterium]
MRIAVDAMGGDYAPGAVVAGSIAAVRELGVEVVLVGPEARVREELGRHRDAPPLAIVDAPEVIEMHEPPAMALRRKKRASIAVAVDLLRNKAADAVMTAGHTGAAMGAALLGLGRIAGVDRPALAVVLPTKTGRPTILLDVGANVDCKPHHLLQFALMGSVYASAVQGTSAPRVGLLNIGVEEGKGSELTLAAGDLLRGSGLNFIGNVEARDVFNGVADVIVCDGFVGNVALKFGQGLALAIRDIVKGELTGLRGKLLLLYLTPLAGRVRRMYRRIDYREYGGAPLLGIDGVVVVAHGSSNARAIRNAIRVAQEAASRGLVEQLRSRMPVLGVSTGP